jgi:hypothetical protein
MGGGGECAENTSRGRQNASCNGIISKRQLSTEAERLRQLQFVELQFQSFVEGVNRGFESLRGRVSGSSVYSSDRMSSAQ